MRAAYLLIAAAVVIVVIALVVVRQLRTGDTKWWIWPSGRRFRR
jgi:hypothetical protein